MNILKVEIENFMAIGQASIELDNKGLWLVQGENRDDTSQDSNGAGKSSLVDAICWGLFGKTARGQTGDGVINRDAKKNCRVSIEVEDNGESKTITRHRKHSKGKNALWVKESGTDVTKGTDKLTQEVVHQILGCSYDVFRAAIYMGQEDHADLPSMTDKQLKQIVEEAAGVNAIESAYTLAREKLREVDKKVEKESWRLDTLSMEVPTLNEEIESATSKVEDWNDEREVKIKGLKRKAKRVKEQAVEKGEAIAKLKLSEIEAELADNEAKLHSVVDEKDLQAKLKAKVFQAKTYVSQSENDFNKALAEVKQLKSKLLGVDDFVGTDCGECGKVYCEGDLHDKKRLLISETRNKAEEAKRLKEEIAKASSQLDAANADLSKHEAGMTDLSDIASRNAEIKRTLKEGASLKSDLEEVKSQVKLTVEKIKDLSAQENPFKALIESAKQKLEKLEEEKLEAEMGIKAFEEELEIAKNVCEVFSPAGVRAHILDTVTPFLNARTSEYLSLLSDGNISATWNTLNLTAKGEVREKFHIAVSSETGGDSFVALSGGEKRKVRLSCVMALQDLVASRASKPINLFIGDEIDHALDASGLERLMGVLETKARERGTVLVISHNELSDWIREQVTVVKENGSATLEGAICGSH